MAGDSGVVRVNQPNLKPTPKVVAGGLGSALVVILAWILGANGIEMPPEVASALTLLVGFVAGYFTKNKV